ncbi:class I SAM-dependent methyltransferase [Yinghuangia sp. YIM S09857]|uniref:class I SAM-dependent methyltransferase n=1 Tax=Yinghuangia sp. YIM S09857 TaxID=3436929 RepID=UPI003F5366B0
MTGSSSPRLDETASAYDAVAELYADLTRGYLDGFPLDRAMLAAFADSVSSGRAGRSGDPAGDLTGVPDYPREADHPRDANRSVAELGCGPGYLTAHLRDLGLDAFGIDLSPAMIGLARAEYPGVRFEVGSMDALDLADASLAGVVSWYSVIHAEPSELPRYFAEFGRVVAPGGHLLLGFFESEGEPVTPFDHKVTTAYRWPVDALAGLATEAGFTEIGRMLREPGDEERFRRGHLLMRKGN